MVETTDVVRALPGAVEKTVPATDALKALPAMAEAMLMVAR